MVILHVSIHSRLLGREIRHFDAVAGGDVVVSIHSRLLGREIPSIRPCCRSSTRFQSTPGFWAGRYNISLSAKVAPALVSIHSRLLGREILYVYDSVTGNIEFQSTPGFWAGRYGRRCRRRLGMGSFNPLPAFGPGDTFIVISHGCSLHVSIHSRLLGREIRKRDDLWEGIKRVSIHSRLLGREIHGSLRHPRAVNRFQSTPGFWAGRYLGVSVESLTQLQFQSTPGFWAGRYAGLADCRCTGFGFNPLPAFGPGDTPPCSSN